MTLRKIAGLLAAFGLTLGLIGGGVGAAFSDQVIANQNIEVGTFECKIVAPSDGTIAPDGKSVTYTAPKILSSAAGSAPFAFTVQNTGVIPQSLTVSTSAVGAPFSIIGAPFAARALAASATTQYATGVQWAELTNANLGAQGKVTWTVSCNEQAPTTPLGFFNLPSTNADNLAGNTRPDLGVPGPHVTATNNGSGSVTLNFTAGSQTGYASCFEYVTDGNIPQQKVATNGGVNYNPAVTDGLFPFKCVGGSSPATASVTLNGISLVQVRMTFGAEADYRFDWTSFTVAP